MDTKVIDERDFVNEFRSDKLRRFFRFIDEYENYIAPILRAQGYKRKNYSERTVMFTFGQVTFSRSRWYKAGVCKIPVDEKLGLAPYEVHSKELIYQIAKLSTFMTYRQVVSVIEMMYGLYITKDTVLKAVKTAAVLLKEKEEYLYYTESSQPEKIKAPIIFIEGDGLYVKVHSEDIEMTGKELSHFVIHTGVEYKNGRKILKNKHTIIAQNNRIAREKVVNYVYNHFELTTDTVLVTNSDLGKGYTDYIFKQMGKTLGIVKHEHFWDPYHIKKDITKNMKDAPLDLKNLLYEGIQKHDKGKARLALDTAESLITENKKLESFLQFKIRLLQYFHLTKPASLRGLPKITIGIMESQHRKITYRMKNRGMYWSIEGSDTMSQMILLNLEDNLRDLFFGSWREEYEKVSHLGYTAAQIKAMQLGVHSRREPRKIRGRKVRFRLRIR